MNSEMPFTPGGEMCGEVEAVGGKGGKRRHADEAEGHQAAQDKTNKHDIPPEWRRAENPYPATAPFYVAGSACHPTGRHGKKNTFIKGTHDRDCR